MGKPYRAKPPYKSYEGLGTEPWHRMSRNGIYVLDRFYAKFNGYNRDNLSLTYREMKGKMSNRLLSSALFECQAYGFIDLVRAGRLEKECSIYRLSNRWRKLMDKPQELDRIGRLLKEIEILKREPGSLEKRMQINQLRGLVLELSRMKKV